MSITQNKGLVDGLRHKVSHPRLTEPAPSKDELSLCYQAAFRSPDHAWLRPWRFIECRGDERVQLGQIMAQAVSESSPDMSDAARDKIANGPLRAPLVLVCYANVSEHPKVPAVEQLISMGCAINNFCSALYGLGYGSVWRTGEAAHSRLVHRRLGLPDTAEIVGIVYVGSAVAEDKEIPVLAENEFVTSLTEHLSDSISQLP